MFYARFGGDWTCNLSRSSSENIWLAWFLGEIAGLIKGALWNPHHFLGFLYKFPTSGRDKNMDDWMDKTNSRLSGWDSLWGLELAGWWFQIVGGFTPTWGRFPIWLIFFKGVETTNQWILFVEGANLIGSLSTKQADWLLSWGLWFGQWHFNYPPYPLTVLHEGLVRDSRA